MRVKIAAIANPESPDVERNNRTNESINPKPISPLEKTSEATINVTTEVNTFPMPFKNLQKR